MPKRKPQPAAQPAEAAEEAAAAPTANAVEPAAKRRRAPWASPQPAPQAASPPARQPRSSRRAVSPASVSAAAAATGRAQSDEGEEEAGGGGGSDASGSDDTPSATVAEGSQQEGGEDEDGTVPGKRVQRFTGVRRSNLKKLKLFEPRLPPPMMAALHWNAALPFGRFGTAEAAARVYDRALIAVLGRKEAAGQLNFPLDDYPGQQQRYGPDLHAFFLHLRGLGVRAAYGKLETRHRKPRSAETRALLLANLQKASAARIKNLEHKVPQQAVAEQRKAEQLSVARGVRCGVCPPCRQPWRTDLGGCLRHAAAKAVGHSEAAVVRLLATDPAHVAAAMVPFKAARQRLQERRQQQQQQRQEQGEQGSDNEPVPARRGRGRRRDGTSAGEEEEEAALEWVQPPPRMAKALALQNELKARADKPLKQQLAWETAQFSAALQREQERGAPPPSKAAGAARPQERADAALLAPDSWLAWARPPRDTFHPQLAQQLVQLAALCRKGGLEAPLAAEPAVDLLEEAQEVQEQLRQRAELVLRHRQERQEQEQEEEGSGSEEGGRAAGSGSAGGGGSKVAAAEAAAEAEAAEGGNRRECTLCGGPLHGPSMDGCPVMQFALAMRQPPPVCPGCADQEQPGCKQCLGGAAGLAQAYVRRAPWLDAVAPATRELMQSLQALSGAAVSDLDLPAAAWRCTPKALLAAGLLAEEAAKLALAPPGGVVAAGAAGEQLQQAPDG